MKTLMKRLSSLPQPLQRASGSIFFSASDARIGAVEAVIELTGV